MAEICKQKISLREGLNILKRIKQVSPSWNGTNTHAIHLQTSLSSDFSPQNKKRSFRINHVIKIKRDVTVKGIHFSNELKKREFTSKEEAAT